MKHLGDITKIHGDQIEPVDCITFGSPCQDLSIAGRRAGLAGGRSGLFVDAARIIKEMRKATNGMYPTFAIWENVPGAFSSNGGEDFRAVLEELARIEQPDVSIPRPSGRGADGAKPEQSLETDGLWLGDSLTLNVGEFPNAERESLLSWILEDNVPQKYYLSARACQGILTRASRRGKPLPEVLRQALLDVIGGWGGNSYTLKIRSGCSGGGKGALVQTEKSATLSTLQDQTLFQPVVYDARGNGDAKIVPTITGDHENRITDYTAIAIERHTFNGQSFSHYKESGKCSTLKAKAGNIGNGSECLVTEKIVRWIVRRLTPVECERLQGFPDGWTDIGEWVDSKGKKHKYADSPRYKALGNSIALPQWFWIAQKMKPYLGENATLGSLFDGIGGFPLVWQKTYGNGTARWASEIEEFPIAVTKRRFGEE
jgi:DNA (cytosine-5)-methyltransferase 1